ncbi:sulfotransferase domain-containing protein [Aquirufa aurantiipilula]|uniref:sulfotransferase domain-containing protein n=1 Tax=Aquirufa aurantiipilula TaxID=2696561 RepID=UPI001CAA594C|nr:sulfotransferase domain-containing protein [Aquirufa aurantiipilula]MBZ1326587.1 sulfotransferase [Aquirufa aurantiipilula]
MNISKSPIFALQENVSNNVVFVDGITRCGKSLFSNILPTLKNTEQLQFFVLLEHIVPALSFQMISPEYAKSSVRTIMNELAYNQLLSRNANFRPGDQTSVLKHPNAEQYFKRLSAEEGDSIIDELRKRNRLFPFMTHDMMVNLEFLDLLEIDYKMIHVLRHPVDMIHSWFIRGWGERFLNDPRSFTLSIDFESKNLPWYCNGVEKTWLKLNPMERCVFTVLNLIECTINQYNKAKYPSKIHNVVFEDFVQDTQIEMDKICQFLGTEPGFALGNALTNARCPRVLDISLRMKKMKEFKNGISEELYVKLLAISDRYENQIYGFKK